jgi:ABC-2 type transport system ATP-binding protein
MTPLLETTGLFKYYQNYCALEDVSISIPEGTIFGLLGPNGAGKTSLIRIITRITAPDKGKVFIAGREMTSNDINQIGYLPEERGLYKKMKVGDQLLYLSQLKGLTEKEAKIKLTDWFVRFGIQDWWNKKVEDLSKGMAQKVQFIATVVHEPKLLILDEPFTGFDPINENLVKDEILRLKEMGSTIIFSTHRMESVEELCDHLALINKSKKVLDGSTKNLRSQYRTHTYRVSGTGSIPQLGDEFTVKENKQNRDGLQELVVTIAPHANTNHFIMQLLPTFEIQHFEEVVPSIKDIFISIVGETGDTDLK